MPAGPDVLAALQQIEVEDHADMADIMRLRISIGIGDGCSGWSVVDDDIFNRLTHLRVGVTIGARVSETLMNAYVIETSGDFSNTPGSSVLNVVAMDPTTLMDLEQKVKPWPNMSDSDIANAIFTSPEYKFTPIVDVTQWRRQETEQTVIQRGTDIQFLRQLAQRNGFECFVETNGLTGAVEGHFHAPKLAVPPQGVLSVNMRDATNVNSFSARYDMMRPATAEATNIDIAAGAKEQAQAAAARLSSLGRTAALTQQRPRVVLPRGQDWSARASCRPMRKRWSINPLCDHGARRAETPSPIAASCEPSGPCPYAEREGSSAARTTSRGSPSIHRRFLQADLLAATERGGSVGAEKRLWRPPRCRRKEEPNGPAKQHLIRKARVRRRSTASIAAR